MGMSFDNQHIDIASIGRPDFEKAMSFFFRHEKATVNIFQITEKHGLVLGWSHDIKNEKTAKELPYEMDVKAATEFAWHWLQKAPLGREPDHDGDNKPAWRVYNESWAKVWVEHFSGLVAIQPIWAMYGK